MAHNEVPSHVLSRKTYPFDPARAVFEAAESGNAGLLDEVLQEMNINERANVLEEKRAHDEIKLKLGMKHGYADLKIKGESTPLIAAAGNGHLDCVRVLLKYKADLESLGHIVFVTLHKVCTSPSVVAAANGHVDVLSCLFEHGADVNASTTEYSPLMIASFFGHVNVVTYLIEHGANMDLHDKDGYTALHLALHSNQDLCGVLSCLIKNGANVNARTNDNCTPLMFASENGHADVVTSLIEHGADVDLQDKDGYTALHYAVGNDNDSCDVLSCLIKHGADVNARSNDDYTSLMIASQCGHTNEVTFLVEQGANMELQDKDGQTALHYAVHQDSGSVDVLSCLIGNGADVDVRTNDNRTPLMIASCWSLDINTITFLTELGANMDLQDKKGDTALHYAVGDLGNPYKVIHKLLSLGASELCNNQGLTPLLSASNLHKSSFVEDLLKRPEYTKEQRVDALELLGASFNAASNDDHFSSFQATRAFCYMKYGMEERFADPSDPLLKQALEPVEAYQDRKESQTLEELAQIEGNRNAIIMESLVIRERILGTDNAELLGPIRCAAHYYKHRDISICIGLHRHAIKIAQSCNQSAISDLYHLTELLYVKQFNVPSRGEVLNELLEQTVLEYEKKQKSRRGLGNESHELEEWESDLFDCSLKLVHMIAICKCCEEDKTSCVTVLRKLFRLNPQDDDGDTLLHKAVEDESCFGFPCIDTKCTVKLLVSAGFNVNAVNNNGDTPLHRAVTVVPGIDKLHPLTEILHVLLDGGAHHDFVNNDGTTAIDIAQTDEARMILSENGKLELKCICARAVRKFGLPYLGVVPKMLEKFISKH